jgi:hypothetical protein
MLQRLMSRLTEAGRRQADGRDLSPMRALGGWFAFLRPSRLLKLLGGCALLVAVFYVIEFRAAADWAQSEAGPNAGAARIERSRSSGWR